MALSWVEAVEGRLGAAGLGTGVLFTVEVVDPGVVALEGFTAIMVSAVVDSLLLPNM